MHPTKIHQISNLSWVSEKLISRHNNRVQGCEENFWGHRIQFPYYLPVRLTLLSLMKMPTLLFLIKIVSTMALLKIKYSWRNGRRHLGTYIQLFHLIHIIIKFCDNVKLTPFLNWRRYMIYNNELLDTPYYVKTVEIVLDIKP